MYLFRNRTVLLFVWLCSVSHGLEISLTMLEEQPPRVTLTTLLGDRQLEYFVDAAGDTMSFKELGSSDYFDISNTGVVSTRKRIDRETVCVLHREECILSADIMASDGWRYVIIKLLVTVEDIDDNLPLFATKELTFTVVEGDNLNVTLTLPAAVDLDTKRHTDTRYRFVEREPDGLMVGMQMVDHAPSLRLTGDLDCEVVQMIHFDMEAFSTRQPDSVSTLRVVLHIVDVNDNVPMFLQDSYQLAVNEKVPVNTAIIQVSATDKDESEANHVVRYKFHQREHNSQFAINELTGEITLNEPLDYEVRSTYTVKVIAYDTGIPSLSSTVSVYITVEDVNDHTPYITYTSAEEDNLPKVLEHSRVGTFVAHIVVADGDINSPNNEVSCWTEPSLLSLESHAQSEYILVVNSDIDREEVSAIDAVITCGDDGFPSNTAQIVIPVEIIDINDHTPAFLSSVYHVYDVSEDTPIGTAVVRLQASDGDAGDNARIKYGLVDDVVPFTVNPNTGDIHVAGVLDQETTPEIEFTVQASDHGSPRLSTTKSIKILLIDVNDNRPVFDQSVYRFQVPESIITSNYRAAVGQVSATDPDEDGHALVWYELEEYHELFMIDNMSGVISTVWLLDRELKMEYKLVVLAGDFRHSQISFSTSVNVYITVEDVNDNAPTFTTPPNTTFVISYDKIAGQTVGAVTAKDLDSADHGKLSYQLVKDSERCTNLFNIDELTGRIFLVQSLTQASVGSYAITVVVTDGANHTDWLDINVLVIDVTTSTPAAHKEKHVPNRHIILGVSLAVGIVVILLAVLAYIRFTRKQAKQTRMYKTRTAIDTRLYYATKPRSNSMVASFANSSQLPCIMRDVRCSSTHCSNCLRHSYPGRRLGGPDSGCVSLSISPLSSQSVDRLRDTRHNRHLVSYQAHSTPTLNSAPREDPTGATEPTVVDQSSTDSETYDSDCSSDCVFSTGDLEQFTDEEHHHPENCPTCLNNVDVNRFGDFKDPIDEEGLHSGNCTTCLENSVVSWSHTHDFDVVNDARLSEHVTRIEDNYIPETRV